MFLSSDTEQLISLLKTKLIGHPGIVDGTNPDGSIIVIQDNEKLVLTGGDVHILD